jgi:hypothetical protein
MPFHGTQIEAAEKIIASYQESPFIVLLAQMQSGKTGTYLLTALKMMEMGLVDHVFIISGSSDKSLRDQAHNDLAEAREEYWSFMDRTVTVEDTFDLLGKFKDNIHVKFSHDLKKITTLPDKTLIIHDESHMAQSKNNMPYREFYLKHGIEGALRGSFQTIREKDIRILGVSATPFSEITSNQKVVDEDWSLSEREILGANHDLESKVIYPMTPGARYVGVSDFLRNGNIRFEASPIKPDSCEHVASVLQQNTEKYDQKYCVIRTHCAEKDSAMIETLATEHGYDYDPIFGGSKESLDFMDAKPGKRTIIHICGRFRMGQVVPKDHIGMVYEQSANPNADTVLQGLVGRMCGYHENLSVDMYVSKKAEDSIRKYAESWNSNEPAQLTGITKAMNLKESRSSVKGLVQKDKDGVKWIQSVPIKFHLRDLEAGFEGRSFGTITLLDIKNAFEDKPELIANNPDKDEIMRALGDGRKPHSQRTNYEKNKSALDSAVELNRRLNISATTKDTKRWTTNEFRAFSIIGNPSKVGEPIFLQGYVRHNPAIHPENETPLATVMPKCNFGLFEVEHEDGTVTEDVNGGQMITFPYESSVSPDVFKENLVEAINRTQEGHPSYVPNCQRSLMSMYDASKKGYKGILFNRETFTQETIAGMMWEVERECGVTLKLTKSRGSQPSEYIRLSSVSW